MTQPGYAEDVGLVQAILDVEYAPPQPAGSQGHLLDLYVPVDQRPAPLVIWCHGSAWLRENGRTGADVVAAQLNRRGFAVAGVATRSSQYAQFPAQLYDIKAAIRWLRAHAQEYGLDPARFGIMGESSGGWTAAMAGVTGDLPELEGDVGLHGPSSRVQAAVPFYPPTDFLQMDAHMLEDCGPFNRMVGATDCHADARSPESLLLGHPIQSRPDLVRQANPISYVRPDVAPFLILHGRLDLLVPYNQSELLYDALSAAGADVTFVTLPRGEHGQWSGYLSDPAINADAFARSSRSGGAAQEVHLSWDMIASFFMQHLAG